MKRLSTYVTGVALVVTLAGPGMAQVIRPALAEMEFEQEDSYLIDAQCAAAFRLMADFGRQRNSELAPAYEKAAEFIVEFSYKKHALDFGMAEDMSLQLVQSKVVLEHEAYVEGLQHENQEIATAELGRFAKDVQFCNLRLRTYEALLNEG